VSLFAVDQHLKGRVQGGVTVSKCPVIFRLGAKIADVLPIGVVRFIRMEIPNYTETQALVGLFRTSDTREMSQQSVLTEVSDVANVSVLHVFRLRASSTRAILTNFALR